MLQRIRRLLWAVVLSATCAVTTSIWYSRSKPKPTSPTTPPIAFAENLVSQVQRRPSTRLLWQSLTDGESLYPGEFIRTSADGKIRIHLLNSGKFIDLEPNTFISLNLETDRVNLELIDGSVFISKKESGKADDLALSLKASDQVYDVGSSTAQISLAKGNAVDIQIFSGEIKDKNGNKTVKPEDTPISAISPKVGQKLRVPDPRIHFEWVGVKKGLKSRVLIGKTRTDLKITSDLIDVHFFTQLLKPGPYFWKVEVFDPQTQKVVKTSSVFRFELESVENPVLASVTTTTTTLPPKPSVVFWELKAEEYYQKFLNEPVLMFRWKSESEKKISSYRLSLGETEADLREVYKGTDLSAKVSVHRPGRYLASVEALDEAGQVLAKSMIATLELALIPLPGAPTWNSKDLKAMAQNDGNYSAEWNIVQDAIAYSFELRDKNNKVVNQAKLKSAKTQLSNLLPGTYFLEVTAVDQYGRRGPASEIFEVIVPDKSAIQAPKLKKMEVQ